MDVPMYNVQATDSSHNDHLHTAIKSLSSDATDLSIVTQDGETIQTWRSLLCIYSSSVANYLSSVPCCSSTSISLPVSSFALNNLLNVLVDGVVKGGSLVELSNVAEASKILGIYMKNVKFGPEGKESYNRSIKIEPEIQNDKIKGKPKKVRVKKEKKIKVKEEPVVSTEERENEKLLQEEDTESKKVLGVISKSDINEDAVDSSFSKAKPWCSQCGKPFKDNYNLERHMMIHSGEKPFKCEQCGKGFNRKERMKIHHLKAHQMNFRPSSDILQKPFACDQCDKTFIKKQYMRNHQRAKHSGEINFTCDLCGQEFSEKRILKSHVKSCGSPSENSDSSRFKKISKSDSASVTHTNRAKLMFNCNLCLAKFPDSKLVVEHLKEHQLDLKAEEKINPKDEDRMDPEMEKQMDPQDEDQKDPQELNQIDPQEENEMDPQEENDMDPEEENETDPEEENEMDPEEENEMDPQGEEEMDPQEEDEMDPQEEDEMDPQEEKEMDPFDEDRMNPFDEDDMDPFDEDRMDPQDEEQLDPLNEDHMDPQAEGHMQKLNS